MTISNSSSGVRPGVCTSTTRPATPYTGMIIYETDTGYLLVWDGAAWDYLSRKQDTAEGLPSETYMGLVKVIPTSVTNGTINATTGTVTVGSAVSSVTVTCFSSLYTNYRVIIDTMGTSTNGQDFRLSLSGVTSGWYYNGYWMQAASNVLNGQNGSNAAFAVIGLTSQTWNTLTVDITNPFTSFSKSVFAQYATAGTNTYVGQFNGVTSTTGSSASFTITPSAGTMTGGSIRVYGYRN